MSPDFTIDIADPRAGIAVVRVAGRLEARAAQELRRRCSDLRDSGRTKILINLSGISFVASSGIGTLLALTEESKESGIVVDGWAAPRSENGMPSQKST